MGWRGRSETDGCWNGDVMRMAGTGPYYYYCDSCGGRGGLCAALCRAASTFETPLCTKCVAVTTRLRSKYCVGVWPHRCALSVLDDACPGKLNRAPRPCVWPSWHAQATALRCGRRVGNLTSIQSMTGRLVRTCVWHHVHVGNRDRRQRRPGWVSHWPGCTLGRGGVLCSSAGCAVRHKAHSDDDNKSLLCCG